MVCKAEKCPFAETCPLQKENVAPKGKQCPIEMMLIDEWSIMYAVSLGIDTQNFIELSMLADIVEAEVYDRRTKGDISLNTLFEMQAVGVDNAGDPILRKEPAVALAVSIMMKKRKDDIRKMFLATREAKAKYKKIETEDITTQLAKIREEIEKRNRQLPNNIGEALDVEIQEAPVDIEDEDRGVKLLQGPPDHYTPYGPTDT